MIFESLHEPLLSRAEFFARILRHFLLALAIVIGSLVMGILGYHYFEGLTWLDSLLNSSMLLGGMGPTSTLQKTAGKLFASFYALYAGLVFIAVASLLSAPVFHRLLHRFHLEDQGSNQ